MKTLKRIWKRQYFINSRDRVEYYGNNTPSDFQLILPDQTPSGEAKFRLFSFLLPFSFYNVPSTRNKIVFNEGGGALTATLTAGVYAIGDLITEIKTQMDSAGGDTYTITYSDTTNKITIASTGTFSMDFSETTASGIIGLSQDKATGASHTMDNVYDLLYGIKFIHLESNILSTAITWNTRTDSQTNEILRVMNRWQPQEIIFLELDNFEPLDIYLPINEITFTLRDELGNKLEMNGVDWGITFIIEKELE